jgi:hypothetical protein
MLTHMRAAGPPLRNDSEKNHYRKPAGTKDESPSKRKARINTHSKPYLRPVAVEEPCARPRLKTLVSICVDSWLKVLALVSQLKTLACIRGCKSRPLVISAALAQRGGLVSYLPGLLRFDHKNADP